METLQEAAIEMLKEFKMLLNFTPLPINSNRLIQLLALNMFAIDNGQLKGMLAEHETFLLQILRKYTRYLCISILISRISYIVTFEDNFFLLRQSKKYSEDAKITFHIYKHFEANWLIPAGLNRFY